MKFSATCILLSTLILYTVSDAYAVGRGNAAAFTRGGYCGAKYIAFGGSAEAAADDVYAVYWNPAGLTAIKGADIKSSDEIRRRAEKGDVAGITQKDLERFGDVSDAKSFQAGVSGSSLSVSRNVIFGGMAFASSIGTFGAGVYSLYSPEIPSYDQAGNSAGKHTYSGSQGILSYARQMGFSSLGISAKGLHETIDDAGFSGAACDIGVQSSPLPFLKIGVVAQDIGAGLYPVSGKDLSKKYETGSPTLRSSVMMESRSAGVSVSAGVVRHIEQKQFIYTAGVRYDPASNVFIAIGFYDKQLSAGAGLKVKAFEFWYAFAYDRIGTGFSNSISLSMVL